MKYKEDKLKIGKYAEEKAVTQAIRYFKNNNLIESTVRDWKRSY